jgi:hypothetical protein
VFYHYILDAYWMQVKKFVLPHMFPAVSRSKLVKILQFIEWA